jgi:prevent-host-death family protein
MKVVEQQDATRPLAEYAAEVNAGTIIVMNHGKPVAALVALEDSDLETVALSTNPQFMRLIERSRASLRSSGGLSAAEIRKQVQ